ncbi:type II toxin-antitoxin system TacA family antitoxin [Leifsonia shinshuensis]
MPTKDRRIEVRVTSAQRELIERAALLQGRTVSDFTADTLTERAEEVVRRDRELRVDEEAFAAFAEALDAPAQTVEGLAELFRRRSVFID